MSVMYDIERLEREIKAREALVEQRQLAQKLENNFEFRKLFIEGYFLTEAARLIQMATDPRVNKDIQNSCQEEARATGFMRRFLSDSIQQGYKAEQELIEMRAVLEELRGIAERGEDTEYASPFDDEE